jgi:pyridine nucleotide-disulfide oxidoreductase family protein
VKHLLLLGGGHAHVHVLKALAAQPMPGSLVTLITPHDDLLYSGMVPGWVAGHYQLEECAIPLRPLARAAGADFELGVACGIDTVSRHVQLADGREVRYDVLSLDTGPVMDRDALPGAREHGVFVRPIEHFTKLWDSIVLLAGERSLCIVVIGGGAAGVELAMAVQYRLGERARVSLVTGGGAPLVDHPRGAQIRAQRALRRLNITEFDDVCVEVTATQVVLRSGARLACDAPIVAIGTSAPRWLAQSGLALDEHGFVATGPTLQSISHPQVFGAGDVASRADAVLPKSGVYAVRAGLPLALNLRRFIAAGEVQPYHPKPKALNLLSCGRRYAIASWGSVAFGGRWVWYWKDHIDRTFVQGFRSP